MEEYERVLMVVKTYPSPSSKYGEVTCTAGIRLRDKQWVRIYPYPFRLLKMDYRFNKYEILELPLEKAKGDPRPESYRLIDPTKIRHVNYLPSKDYWERRMEYIRPTVSQSLKAFEKQMVQRKSVPDESLTPSLLGDDPVSSKRRGEVVWGRSIGVVAVQQGSATVEAKYLGNAWPEEDKAKLEAPGFMQEGLFIGEDSPYQVPKVTLRFCPYQFYLRFKDAIGDEFRKPITDWEIYQLFFNEEERLRSCEAALESVRHKIEKEIFAPERETFLVVGSIHHRYARPNLYAVIGFIWPKRRAQIPLF